MHARCRAGAFHAPYVGAAVGIAVAARQHGCAATACQQAGGGEERTEPQIAWTIGGSPIDYHNAVVRADLTPQQADEVIAESIERLRAYNVPGTWHVGPGMRPADLGARLIAHGFNYAGDDIGMAANLSALPATLETLPGLVIDRVRDEQDLAIWTRTLAAG